MNRAFLHGCADCASDIRIALIGAAATGEVFSDAGQAAAKLPEIAVGDVKRDN